MRRLATFVLLAVLAGCGGGTSPDGGTVPAEQAGAAVEPRSGILFEAPGVGHDPSGDFAAGDIFLVQPDGTGLTPLTRTRRGEFDPVWRPDRRQVAFVRSSVAEGVDYPETCTDILVANADGSGETTLTGDEACELWPAWSPDGTRLAFVSDREGEQEIFLINADGTGLRQLTQGAGLVGGERALLSRPAFSPDGSRLVFHQEFDRETEDEEGSTEGFLICFVKADGTGQTCPAAGSAPAWSPDGTRVVFSRRSRSTPEGLSVMNADGTGQRPLTRGADSSPAWSPDGSTIIFERVEGLEGQLTVSRLVAVRPDGSGLRRVVDDPRVEPWLPPWVFSPDGARLAFAAVNAEGLVQVHVVNLDGTGLRRLTAHPHPHRLGDWR
jgi:Tol biopolymer transport system component